MIDGERNRNGTPVGAIDDGERFEYVVDLIGANVQHEFVALDDAIALYVTDSTLIHDDARNGEIFARRRPHIRILCTTT